MKRPETPLLQKLRIERDKTLVLGQFLDWLEDEEIHLAAYDERGHSLDTIVYSKERIIGRFLGIDPTELDKEREALLEYQRWLNDTDPCTRCKGSGELPGDYHRDERECSSCNGNGRIETA